MDAARPARGRPLPPEKHWAARARFVGGGLVYVVAIIVALFSAIASFVIIALVAVYYIVERTPASPASPGTPALTTSRSSEVMAGQTAR